MLTRTHARTLGLSEGSTVWLTPATGRHRDPADGARRRLRVRSVRGRPARGGAGGREPPAVPIVQRLVLAGGRASAVVADACTTEASRDCGPRALRQRAITDERAGSTSRSGSMGHQCGDRRRPPRRWAGSTRSAESAGGSAAAGRRRPRSGAASSESRRTASDQQRDGSSQRHASGRSAHRRPHAEGLPGRDGHAGWTADRAASCECSGLTVSQQARRYGTRPSSAR